MEEEEEEEEEGKGESAVSDGSVGPESRRGESSRVEPARSE